MYACSAGICKPFGHLTDSDCLSVSEIILHKYKRNACVKELANSLWMIDLLIVQVM